MTDQDHLGPELLDYAPANAPTVLLYCRVLCAVLIAAGMVLAVVGLAVDHEPAKVNIWTAASGMLLWGFVIRFQHVRL